MIKLQGGEIPNFQTNELYKSNVYIKEGVISLVSQMDLEASIIIDCEGLVISPGFIDIHMHEEVIGETEDGEAYDIAYKMLKMGVTTGCGGNCGNNRQSLEDFSSYVLANKAPINYLSYTGHNFARRALGINDYDTPTKSEMLKVKDYLARDIENFGAIGISYGLEYSPGTSYEEAVYYGKDHSHDILLSAHYRKDAKYALDAINEMISISKDTKLPMQISHIGSCSAYGMMKESLELISKERQKGADIMADCYPYDAFSTFIGSAVYDEGCFELWNKSYDSILLTEEPYRGQRCDEELFYRVKKEYPQMLSVAFVMNEEEVRLALKSDFMHIASDGMMRKGKGHPRAAGTFPRVLGKYVRQNHDITLIDALRKMTLSPAQRLGLISKGEIREGFDADITVFDKDLVIDKATYEEPSLPPEGIKGVIVNGEFALLDNIIKNNRSGRYIHRKELRRVRNEG